ncbi:MAG TPA: S8 family peptidase [Gemmata sp.]|jgi:subtilisin family serine protease|nr:S8 family peptidase [Gemmata sp.]
MLKIVPYVAILALVSALCLTGAQPLPVAPMPAGVMDDGMPNPEYRIPDGELAPDEVVILEAAGDVSDWGHTNLKIAECWKSTKGKGVKVLVLDTGADHGHRDLKNKLKGSKDFTNSRSGAADVNGHGTHCLGIIGAEENGVGVVGVAPECDLYSGKVLGDNGSGLSTWIAAGIRWGIEQDVDVISMSLGSPGADARIHAAVREATAAGIVVVAAAGNEGPRDGTVGFPGGFPECVCVAAADSNEKIANFSSRGPRVDVAAPGVNVRSCYPGDRFATMSGTSMATPYVAGCAALWVAAHPDVKKADRPAAFRKDATATAKDLAPAGKDNASGHGFVQPAGFVKAPPKKPDDPVDPPPPGPDRVVFEPGDLTLPPVLGGRKVRRVILELEPVKP